MPTDAPLAMLGAVLLALGSALAWRAERLARWLTAGVLTLLVGQLLVRSLMAERLPVMGTFEMNLAETACLLALALWLARHAGPGFLRAPLAIGALTLLHVLFLRTEITPQTISERSLWVDVHSILAWITWAAYFNATCLAFREGECQVHALRWLSYGYLAHTAIACTGIYYATILFAVPWSWDPVQTLALLSWLLYSIVFHFRLFFAASLYRLRFFLVVLAVVYVLSAKLLMYLPFGQTFHVFELGRMAGPW